MDCPNPSCKQKNLPRIWTTRDNRKEDQSDPYFCCEACFKQYLRATGIHLDKWQRMDRKRYNQFPQDSWVLSLIMSKTVVNAEPAASVDPESTKRKSAVFARGSPPAKKSTTGRPRGRPRKEKNTASTQIERTLQSIQDNQQHLVTAQTTQLQLLRAIITKQERLQSAVHTVLTKVLDIMKQNNSP